MADKQLLLKKNAEDGFFADDDPLAELARLVNFESADIPARPVATRREPEFNLEDELLKEFEQYEAPERLDPRGAPEAELPPSPVHPPSVAERAEPVFAEQPAPEPVLPSAPATLSEPAPVADIPAPVVEQPVHRAPVPEAVAARWRVRRSPPGRSRARRSPAAARLT